MTPIDAEEAGRRLAEAFMGIQMSLTKIRQRAITPEERFEKLIEGYQRDFDLKNYPDSLFIHCSGKFLFEYDQVNKYCWVSYLTIWSVFDKEFGYTYDQIKDLITRMVEEHFGWKGATPKLSQFNQLRVVEEHFGWKGATPVNEVKDAELSALLKVNKSLKKAVAVAERLAELLKSQSR